MLFEGRLARSRAAVGRAGAAAMIVLGAVAAPGLLAGPPAHASPGLRWTPCDDPKHPGAECATLPVPVDWAHPDGPTFGLALARRTATGPGPRVGALVFGPGGPGDSGVDRVVTGIGRFSAEVRQRFDIVSFDPRGVGQSSPGLDCALHDRDVRAAWQGLLARADRGELADPSEPGTALSPMDLVNGIAFRSFYQADFAGLAKKIAAMEKSTPLPASPTSPAALPPAAPVFCADWHLPVRDHRDYAALLRTMNRAAPDLPYLLPLHITAACLGAPTANPQHRLTTHGTPPILLSNAVHDPATGYPWAESVARQFGRSGVLLTYEGWGHGSATSGPCMENAVDRYLIDLEVPARGTRCPAV